MFFAVMAYSPSETVKYTSVSSLLILNIVSFILAFISIFLYRHRMIQIRVCIFNAIILVGFQGWILWLFFSRPEGSAFSATALFPFVSAILCFLAMKYIARDEAMVRSTSRLRK
jgi:hypothetical protein